MLTNKRKLLSYAYQLLVRRNFGLDPEDFCTSKQLNTIRLPNLEVEKEIYGEFKDKIVLSKEYIEKLINNLFDAQLMSALLEMGISNPKLNFVTFYRTKHIPSNTKSVFANHWHFDSTVEMECVKLFYCPNPITKHQGPMEFLDSKTSKTCEEFGFFRGPTLPFACQTKQFKGSKGQGLLLKPFYCLHRAGIPEKGLVREMLMLQIVNGGVHRSSEELYQRQFLAAEPTLKHDLMRDFLKKYLSLNSHH